MIYGASDYTGRLIAKFLRDYRVPFVVAGRSCANIEEAMRAVSGLLAPLLLGWVFSNRFDARLVVTKEKLVY